MRPLEFSRHVNIFPAKAHSCFVRQPDISRHANVRKNKSFPLTKGSERVSIEMQDNSTFLRISAGLSNYSLGVLKGLIK